MLDTRCESRKCVLRSEIRLLIDRKPRPTVVIYRHLDQTRGTAKEKIERQLECLSNELGLA